jgi:hypothetical protein
VNRDEEIGANKHAEISDQQLIVFIEQQQGNCGTLANYRFDPTSQKIVRSPDKSSITRFVVLRERPDCV